MSVQLKTASCGAMDARAKSTVASAASFVPRAFALERLRQLSKFCLVGGSGTLVDMGLLYLLADPNRLGWNVAWSKLGAAEIALVNNFVWNEVWTFKALTRPSVARLMKLGAADVSPLHLESGKSQSRLTSAVTVQRFKARMMRGNLSQPMGVGRGEGFPRLRRFLLFNAICGMGILFAVALLELFHGRLGWNLYLANLLTIGLVTLWNFGMNVRFNWRLAGMRDLKRGGDC